MPHCLQSNNNNNFLIYIFRWSWKLKWSEERSSYTIQFCFQVFRNSHWKMNQNIWRNNPTILKTKISFRILNFVYYINLNCFNIVDVWCSCSRDNRCKHFVFETPLLLILWAASVGAMWVSRVRELSELTLTLTISRLFDIRNCSYIMLSLFDNFEPVGRLIILYHRKPNFSLKFYFFKSKLMIHWQPQFWGPIGKYFDDIIYEHALDKETTDTDRDEQQTIHCQTRGEEELQQSQGSSESVHESRRWDIGGAPLRKTLLRDLVP